METCEDGWNAGMEAGINPGASMKVDKQASYVIPKFLLAKLRRCTPDMLLKLIRKMIAGREIQ